MSEAFTLYKLIILYMLDKIDFPLTTSQLSEFILDKGYTNYFTFQQALSDMVEGGLVNVETTHNRSLYNLTDKGEETISFFHNKISPEIQQDILEFIKDKRYELKNETSIKSDYYLNTDHEYTVHCQIIEKNIPLIDLSVTVPSESAAETAVNNWNKNNQEIYALLMQNLLS